MTNPSKRAIGNNAEDIACQYLLELGWDIIERNYYAGHNEIDIIAKDEDIIVFIEVKDESSTHFGLPIEHVNETKVFRILKLQNDGFKKTNINMLHYVLTSLVYFKRILMI